MRATTVPSRHCRHCHAEVLWLHIYSYKQLPFDARPIPVDRLPEQTVGWVPGRRTVYGKSRAVMLPINQVGHQLRTAIRQVLTVHSCQQYEATKEQP